MSQTNTHIIVDGAMTGTATVVSTPINVTRVDRFTIQARWSGTPNGAIKVQVSNDDGTGTLNWTDLPSSSVSITGAAGSTLYSVNNVAFVWVRLSYTNTSSTGTLNARMYTR
jgi:hypothetical protein